MLTTHFYDSLYDPFYDTVSQSILRHIFTPGRIPIQFTTQFPNPFYDTVSPVQGWRQVTFFWERHSAPCSFHGMMDEVFMSTLTYKLLHVIKEERRVTFSEFVQVEVVMQRKEVTWSTFVQVRLIPARPKQRLSQRVSATTAREPFHGS